MASSSQSVKAKTLYQLLNSEQDPKVLAAAERALIAINRAANSYSGVETVFFGLSLGLVLVLAGYWSS
ncbi:hypothetical protein OK016_12845 [Vibrio chagasii]|nr:hypothetical protein [Vibrio chagasii]